MSCLALVAALACIGLDDGFPAETMATEHRIRAEWGLQKQMRRLDEAPHLVLLSRLLQARPEPRLSSEVRCFDMPG